MSDYTSKRAVIKVLEDCHLDKELFEKDVFDSINALPTLDEKEIIRKAFERVVERLEQNLEECKKYIREYDDSLPQKTFHQGILESLRVVKEEGGIE